MIKNSMASRNRPEKGTELLEITQFDSIRIFCEFGKTVKVSKGTYQNKQAAIPINDVIYARQIVFFFDFEDNN